MVSFPSKGFLSGICEVFDGAARSESIVVQAVCADLCLLEYTSTASSIFWAANPAYW